MKIRLLLINAASKFGGASPPLGLLYMAACARREINGIEIRLLDMALEDYDLEGVFRQFRPDIIGIGAASCNLSMAVHIAEKAKLHDRKIKVILGGSHFSGIGESRRLIAEGSIDYIMLGESELRFPRLIMHIMGRELPVIEGVVYKKYKKANKKATENLITGKIPVASELDSLPFPAWDLIDIKKYSEKENWNGMLKKKPYMPIITSRGCPFRCSFCHNSKGSIYRARSPENVFSEIKELYESFGVREFHIIDDLFNYDLKRCKKICDLIIGYGRPVSLAFPNGLRADMMDEELIDKLKKAGAYKINYGIETPVKRIQEKTSKKVNLDKLENIIRLTREKGIITLGFFMIGFPGETKEEILETIRFAEKSDLDLAKFSFVSPLPNTILFEQVNPKEEKISFSGSFHRPNNFSAVGEEDIKELYKEALRRFYLSPKRLLRLFKVYGIMFAPGKIFSIYNYVSGGENIFFIA